MTNERESGLRTSIDLTTKSVCFASLRLGDAVTPLTTNQPWKRR